MTRVRCPSCAYLNEVEQPNTLHPRNSFDKPEEADVDGDVIEKIYDCRNEKCRNPFTVYWFMPKRKFNVV